MTAVKIQPHASIDTPDLDASVAFYRSLLGSEPTLERHDYARFDLSEPPLVLGLNAAEGIAATRNGALEHLGLRVQNDADLNEIRTRLQSGGVALDEEPETECCYSRLSRFWATDPSGVQWEIFIARDAVVESESRAGEAGACCAPTCCGRIDA